MGSTNIPSNKEIKKVRMQLKTPDDDQPDVYVATRHLQEWLTTLVDCEYMMAGCIVNDYVKDIRKHESGCLYRTQPCFIPSNKDACKNVQAKNLVEHWTEHHNADCMAVEENFFSLPIDLEQEVQLSKMVTVGDDIFLCRFKSEDTKLHIYLLFIKTTNPHRNYKITLMADDMVCNKHKIPISNSGSGFSEFNEQSTVFDLEKLTQIRNVFKFDSITVRVAWNNKVQEKLLQDEKFLQMIVCTTCEDFLTSTNYVCSKGHSYCYICYALLSVSKNTSFCAKCSSYNENNTSIPLTLIDSFQKYEFPCQNQSLGCKQVISRFTSKHELLCPFKVFRCVICAKRMCRFTGKYSNFISHLQQTHTDDIVSSNVYNVTDMNRKWCYMFAFGSVFLCEVVDKQTCAIQWVSTSVLEHNFTFEATFIGNGKSLILSTSDTRETNYNTKCCKSVFNIIKKRASFSITLNELIPNVGQITFRIHKK